MRPVGRVALLVTRKDMFASPSFIVQIRDEGFATPVWAPDQNPLLLLRQSLCYANPLHLNPFNVIGLLIGSIALTVDAIHVRSYEFCCDVRFNGVTESAQLSHAIGYPISQRECPGLNGAGFSISTMKPVDIAPKARRTVLVI